MATNGRPLAAGTAATNQCQYSVRNAVALPPFLQIAKRFFSTNIVRMHRLIVVIAYAILSAACSSAPHYGSESTSVETSAKRVDLSDTRKVKQILNQQYKDWNHVQHRMGGTSKNGIDCSGLVYKTYRTKLGVDLPRSTESQSKTGSAVKQKHLRAGDLVFFKTGIFSRHVGMYIDKGDFLHVSTRKGVMISNLDEPYWRSTYWKARRVQ